MIISKGTFFVLFQFKHLFEFQLIGSISDECLKLACFSLPGCSCFIIEAECLLIDGDVYILALSRLQETFWNPFSSL